MATPSNKPRDIKNLKARLGRTITPGQTGTPGGIPGAPNPQGAVPGATVPPPVVGGGFPGVPGQPGQPSAPAASPYGRPAGAQPSRSPLGGPAAGNPLGQTGAARPAPGNPLGQTGAAAAPAAGGGRVDPFAISTPPAAAAQKRVTLVIDDSAVKEDEIGRKSRTRGLMIAGVGAVVGLGIGFGIGNTMDKRTQYSMAVRDGKEIYAKIQEVSKNVDAAKELVKKAVDAASAGGKGASVDVASIEQLVQLKRPFTANEFHRRLYRAFGDNVVDELFDYYNNVNLLWDGFTSLGAKTAGEKKRDALAKSAAAADGLVSTDYGVVYAKQGNAFAGGLVFMTVNPVDPAAAEEGEKKKGKGKKAKDAAPVVTAKVSSAQGGQEVERNLFTGQTDVGESIEKYVFAVDKARSATILGESANLFAKYRSDLMELNQRMEKTIEVQGRLTKDLGPIAAMSE
jgi:hypothetical protein